MFLFRTVFQISLGGAVMRHQIDLSDHYSLFDSSITPLNFLKYSDFVWQFFSSTLYYQNRVLISEYREMHEDAGFKILREVRDKCPADLLDKIGIAIIPNGSRRICAAGCSVNWPASAAVRSPCK